MGVWPSSPFVMFTWPCKICRKFQKAGPYLARLRILCSRFAGGTRLFAETVKNMCPRLGVVPFHTCCALTRLPSIILYNSIYIILYCIIVYYVMLCYTIFLASNLQYFYNHIRRSWSYCIPYYEHMSYSAHARARQVQKEPKMKLGCPVLEWAGSESWHMPPRCHIKSYRRTVCHGI